MSASGLDTEYILSKKEIEKKDFDVEAFTFAEDGWQLIIPNLPLTQCSVFIENSEL